MATGLSGLADSIALQGERANAFENTAKRIDVALEKRNENMMLEQKRKLAEQVKEKDLRDAMQEKLHSNIVKVSNVDGLLPKDVDEVQKDAMDFYTDANLHQYKTGKDWTTDPKLLEKYQGLQKKVAFAKQDKQGLDQFGNFHAKTQDAYDLDKEGLMGYASKGIEERMSENPMTDPSYYQGRFQKPKSLDIETALSKGGLKDIHESLVPKSQVTLANGNIVEVNDPAKYKENFVKFGADILDEVHKGEAPASMTGLYSTIWKKVNIEHADEPDNIKKQFADDLFVTKVAENQYAKAEALYNSQLKTTTFKQSSKANGGLEINFGQGGSLKKYNIGEPLIVDYWHKGDDKKSPSEQKEFYAIQTITPSDNHPTIALGNNKGVLEGVYKNSNGQVDAVRMKIPHESADRETPTTYETKIVPIKDKQELEVVKANIGDGFTEAIGIGKSGIVSKKTVPSQGKKEGVKVIKYEVNGKMYNIPEADVKDFLKDFPTAKKK